MIKKFLPINIKLPDHRDKSHVKGFRREKGLQAKKHKCALTFMLLCY